MTMPGLILPERKPLVPNRGFILPGRKRPMRRAQPLLYTSFFNTEGAGGGAPAPGGADINVAVVSDTLRTTVGTQDFTKAGFGTPKAFLVYGMASGGNVLYSIGASDGTNQWCDDGGVDGGQSSTDTYRRGFTTRIFAQENLVGSTAVEVAFDSFITDGVRINVTKTDGTTHRLVFVFFNGDDLSVDCGTTALATDGNSATVSPGFETNVLVLSRGGLTYDGADRATFIAQLGLASYDGSTILQVNKNSAALDNQAAGDPLGYVDDSKILTATSGSWTVTLENITSTSFDLAVAGLDLSTNNVGYLALNIGGGNAWAGVLDSPTGTGNHTFTDPGFTPILGLILPSMITAVNTAKSNAEAGGYGIAAFDADDEWCIGWSDEDTADPTNCSGHETNQAIDLDTDANVDAFDATFVEFTASGVTLNFSAADGTTRKWPALFIGNGS